jgi:hypothetical protein
VDSFNGHSGSSPGTAQEQTRLPESSQSISTTDLFESLWYRCCDPIWFDDPDRPKTKQALVHLVERVPSDIVEDFDVLVFAPAPGKYGQLYPNPNPPKNPQDEGVTHFEAEPKRIIYLAPILESLDQAEVDFVVAHEFAHHRLGHHNYTDNTPAIEDEADALAESWGFIVPARRKENR